MLIRHFGDAVHLDWVRIDGHEVWRVQQIGTQRTVIVKSGANVATARAMAHSGVVPQVFAEDDASGI
ncbi:MAG: hypothetical protein OXL38_02000 [Gammaproteobacteria bacterium]|nr:hypothetical protein [Gammaproteobacteria bacterium]